MSRFLVDFVFPVDSSLRENYSEPVWTRQQGRCSVWTVYFRLFGMSFVPHGGQMSARIFCFWNDSVVVCTFTPLVGSPDLARVGERDNVSVLLLSFRFFQNDEGLRQGSGGGEEVIHIKGVRSSWSKSRTLRSSTGGLFWKMGFHLRPFYERGPPYYPWRTKYRWKTFDFPGCPIPTYDRDLWLCVLSENFGGTSGFTGLQ